MVRLCIGVLPDAAASISRQEILSAASGCRNNLGNEDAADLADGSIMRMRMHTHHGPSQDMHMRMSEAKPLHMLFQKQ